MKLIIQRVKSAKMSVNSNFKCEINRGIVAYLGITHEDDIKDINYCVDKLIHLRIFDDENGKLKGDVVFDEVKEVASAITPVPGGVGSVTTTMMLEAVYEAYHA